MKLIVLIVLFSNYISCLEVVQGLQLYDHESIDFDQYLEQYGKQYQSQDEYQMRKSIFLRSQELVQQHNSNPDFTWKIGINQFSDRTFEDLKWNGKPIMKLESGKKQLYNTTDQVPIDWSSIMSPSINQESCDSAWALTAINVIEARYYLKYNKSIILSTQQLLSCDDRSLGCEGGSPYFAFLHAQFQGLMLASDYPYHGNQKLCRYDKSKVVARVKSIKTENDVFEALKSGPTLIRTQSLNMLYYIAGIFDGICGEDTNHQMPLVGWGIENNVQYWIAKNHWGDIWGEKGYIRIKMNGNCQIQHQRLIPIIE